MTEKHFEITIEEFESRFMPLPNHINPKAGWTSGPDGRGCLFEADGLEFEFIRRLDPKLVWTVIDGERGRIYVRSGLQMVNRVGYLLSCYPVPEGTSFCVCVPFRSDT